MKILYAIYAVAIIVFISVGALNVSRWMDCSDHGGRFMRNVWGQWECIK